MKEPVLELPHGGRGSAFGIASFALCFFREDDGVTALEYGLLAMLIVLAAIGGIQATGTSLSQVYVLWTNAVLGAL